MFACYGERGWAGRRGPGHVRGATALLVGPGACGMGLCLTGLVTPTADGAIAVQEIEHVPCYCCCARLQTTWGPR